MARSSFECTGCHHTWPLPRRGDRRRKRGHIKHLWCIRCKRRTPHREHF